MAETAPPPMPRSPYDYSETLWWEPEQPQGGGGLLSEEQRARFVTDGFLALDSVWPMSLTAQAAEEGHAYFPLPGNEGPRPSSELVDPRAVDRRGRPWPSYVHRSNVVWPALPFMHLEDQALSPDMALNHIPLWPRMLAIAAQLMSTTEEDLRLSQCVLRARYGPPLAEIEHGDSDSVRHAGAFETDQGDQQLHVDYGNNSLVVPTRLPGPDAVAGLIYYDRVEDVGSPTHAAPCRPGELTSHDDDDAPFNPPNHGLLPGRSAERLQQLYDEERPVRYQVGTVLLYRLVSPGLYATASLDFPFNLVSTNG
jgi:hypothetical protein